MAKSIAGKVISIEFDLDVEKQAGGKYKAWSLTYRDDAGKTAAFTKPMAGLKFQPALKGALQDLKPGDDFVAQMEKNKSDFWEITSISKGGALPVSANGASGQTQAYRTDRMARSESDAERQTSIIRQSSLKAAVDLYKGSDNSIEDVLKTAAEFEAWVTRKDEE